MRRRIRGPFFGGRFSRARPREGCRLQAGQGGFGSRRAGGRCLASTASRQFILEMAPPE